MSDTAAESLSTKLILKFWGPLSFTWLMMALDGPFLTALVARLPDAKYNLAGFGVAWVVAIMIEAPVIPIMSATATLLNGQLTFNRIRNFIYTLNALTTLMMVLVAWPSVFDPLARSVLHLDPKIAEIARQSLFYLWPWPAAIGYRRFYQGVLIRHNRTDRVAKGTTVRLISLLASGYLLFYFSSLPGASIGSLALAISVSLEAIVTRILAQPVLNQYYRGPVTSSLSENLTYRALIHFYTPMVLTIAMIICVSPLTTFAVGHSRRALDSLAVIPVMNSFLFLLQSFAMGLQETVIVLVGDRFQHLAELRRFTVKVAIILSLVTFVFAFTDLSRLCFTYLSGLQPDLTDLASSALRVAVPLPLITVASLFMQSILTKRRRTTLITQGTATQLLVILIVLYLTVGKFNFVGAYAALLANLLGAGAAALYMACRLRNVSSNPPIKAGDVATQV